MHSNVRARVTAETKDQITVGVTHERCPGCDGRCGFLAFLPASQDAICLSKGHFRAFPEDNHGAIAGVGAGGQVSISVQSKTLIGLSSLVYLTPLLLMLLSAVACFRFYSQSDAAVAVCAGFGLVCGVVVVRLILVRLEQTHLAGTLFIKAR